MAEEEIQSGSGIESQGGGERDQNGATQQPDFMFFRFLSTLFLVLAFVCIGAGAWIITYGVNAHDDLLFFYGLILGVAGSLHLLFFAAVIRLLISIAQD